MHALMKIHSGFMPDTPDAVVSAYWEHFAVNVFKPCGILDWCPYGPLVEDFPLEEEDLAEWNLGEGADPQRCVVFGHYCPVYFRAEPMIDSEACQTMPSAVVGCEHCPIDACERSRSSCPDAGCGDPLCRTCFVKDAGAGIATLGCEPPTVEQLLASVGRRTVSSSD